MFKSKFWKTRFATILVTALATMLVISGVAYGANMFSAPAVSGSVTVYVDTPGLALFSDAECTTPLGALNFGSLRKGETSAPITVYVKNTGNIAFTSITSTSTFTSGAVIFTGTTGLAPNESRASTIKCMVDIGATPNTYPFTVTISGNY